MTPRMPITKEAAIALAQSDWWVGLPPKTIAMFQLHTELLCMPFHEFHVAIETALGRPVWTHEFGLNWDGLCKELRGEEPAPTFEEIIALIPEGKRILL